MQIERCLSICARALFGALFCTLFAATGAAQEGPYKVLDRWKLADVGGWDYLLVDSPAHRVYITRGDHVDVVDTKDGKLIGTIGGLHGTHGVALNPDGKVGYISDGGGNAVVVFDPRIFLPSPPYPPARILTPSFTNPPPNPCGLSMVAARTSR